MARSAPGGSSEHRAPDTAAVLPSTPVCTSRCQRHVHGQVSPKRELTPLPAGLQPSPCNSTIPQTPESSSCRHAPCLIARLPWSSVLAPAVTQGLGGAVLPGRQFTHRHIFNTTGAPGCCLHAPVAVLQNSFKKNCLLPRYSSRLAVKHPRVPPTRGILADTRRLEGGRACAQGSLQGTTGPVAAPPLDLAAECPRPGTLITGLSAQRRIPRPKRPRPQAGCAGHANVRGSDRRGAAR